MKDNPEHRLLVHGISGTGKSTFLATVLEVPCLLPALYLDVDSQITAIRSKVHTLSSLEDLSDPCPDKLNRLKLNQWNDLEMAYDFVFKKKAASIKDSFNSIILDGWTDINFKALDQASGQHLVKIGEIKNPTEPEYGKAHWAIRQIARKLVNFEGVSIFGSAQPKDQTGIDSSLQMLKPYLTGQLSEILCGLHEFVGYLKSDNQGKRSMQWVQKGKIYAKERSEGEFVNGVFVKDSPFMKDTPDPTIGKFHQMVLAEENKYNG